MIYSERLDTPSFYHSKSISIKDSNYSDDSKLRDMTIFSFGASLNEKKTSKFVDSNFKESSKRNKSDKNEDKNGNDKNDDDNESLYYKKVQHSPLIKNDIDFGLKNDLISSNSMKHSNGPVLPYSVSSQPLFHEGDEGATLDL